MAVYDISNRAEPRQIGFMPVEGSGLHRIWYVGGRWAYASYQNAGIRVYAITDQFRPVEVGACAPPAPKKLIDPRPNRPVVLHSADVFVDKNGLCYCTDWSGAGL